MPHNGHKEQGAIILINQKKRNFLIILSGTALCYDD